MTPPQPRELAFLGFDVDEPVEGNHQRTIDVASDADMFALADLVLTALYRAYGARSLGDIKVSAPLAEVEDKILEPCPALS